MIATYPNGMAAQNVNLTIKLKAGYNLITEDVYRTSQDGRLVKDFNTTTAYNYMSFRVRIVITIVPNLKFLKKIR